MRLPPRSSLAFWGFLVCLTGVTFVRLDLRARPRVVAAAADLAAAAADTVTVRSVPPAPAAAVDAAGASVAAPLSAPEPIADTLGQDESIYLCLKAHRIPEVEIARIGRALSRVFDAKRHTRPGDVLRLQLDSLGSVVRFEYTPVRTPERPVVIERGDDGLTVRRERIDLVAREAAIDVTIEDNLFNAIAGAGESDALTDLLVDRVFGSVIDFHKDPRRGDRLDVLFTRLYMDDRFVRYGRVLLARYRGRVVSQEGVYYADPSGRSDFYDATGTSLERMFLLKPMEFRRISSPFSRRRFHPILKRNVPHLGTDYAAAPGTPVWATARGRVTRAGWNGGYGKMVEIEHPNGYRTRYAHLSRIEVRKGQRVDKFDVVGRVGATGRATGPHLHYELLHKGRQIDPRLVNRGDRARTLPTAYLDAFQARRQRLEDRLEATIRIRSRAVVADASPSGRPLDTPLGGP